jgi:hypothetical protein
MSLENPHKIAKKDGHLHEIAKKDGRLPYLVILCQHTVLGSLDECYFYIVGTRKIHLIAFLQSQYIIAGLITSQ